MLGWVGGSVNGTRRISKRGKMGWPAVIDRFLVDVRQDLGDPGIVISLDVPGVPLLAGLEHDHALGQFAHVVQARGSSCESSHITNRHQEKAHQDAENGNHDKQFDEGETR